jgi:hypothetical protein
MLIMLEAIMTGCGCVALLFLAVCIISFARMFKGVKNENAELKAKAMPMAVIGFGGLFVSGGAWAVCLFISLFV